MSETLFVPFPRKLYDDLIRFSDGRCDPVDWAVDRLEAWIDTNFSSEEMGLGWANDRFMGLFEDRLEEFAEEYYPSILEHWSNQDANRVTELEARRRPLVWKLVVVPAGSEVRMSYDGQHHYGKVHDGKIKDDDGEFSPSEWASKVAGGTSRNAWRDLWFKFPGDANWVPATLLRERARANLKGKIAINL